MKEKQRRASKFRQELLDLLAKWQRESLEAEKLYNDARKRNKDTWRDYSAQQVISVHHIAEVKEVMERNKLK